MDTTLLRDKSGFEYRDSVCVEVESGNRERGSLAIDELDLLELDYPCNDEYVDYIQAKLFQGVGLEFVVDSADEE